MERKIAQIAVAGGDDFKLVVALCNDGTTWRAATSEKPMAWRQLPPIPQPPHKVRTEIIENIERRKVVWRYHMSDGTFIDDMPFAAEP